MAQITSSKVHPTKGLKEGAWHFARTVGKPGRLFHKYGGILHEFWTGPPFPGHTHSSLIEDGGKTLKVKVLEIGDWDMDAASTKDVTHGLGASWTKVCAIRAIIIDDAATVNIDINLSSIIDGTATGYGSVAYANSSVIQLRRITGGAFDSTTYNATSFNRGFITIWYF